MSVLLVYKVMLKKKSTIFMECITTDSFLPRALLTKEIRVNKYSISKSFSGQLRYNSRVYTALPVVHVLFSYGELTKKIKIICNFSFEKYIFTFRLLHNDNNNNNSIAVPQHPNHCCSVC